MVWNKRVNASCTQTASPALDAARKNNNMKMKIIVALITGLWMLSTAQNAAAEVIRQSGEATDDILVPCLNDTIVVNWQFDRTIAVMETKSTWMFTRSVRQKGSAVDSFGNRWKFNGHFQTTEHVDLTADLGSTNFHLLSHDVMVGEPGGPGNLLFKTMIRIRVVDGEIVVDDEQTTVSCLN